MTWPLRLVVRTTGFHPVSRGSIPLGVTNAKTMREHGFCIGDGMDRTGGEKSHGAGLVRSLPGTRVGARGDSPRGHQKRESAKRRLSFCYRGNRIEEVRLTYAVKMTGW